VLIDFPLGLKRTDGKVAVGEIEGVSLGCGPWPVKRAHYQQCESRHHRGTPSYYYLEATARTKVIINSLRSRLLHRRTSCNSGAARNTARDFAAPEAF
jgi:hypothetical protein